MVGWLPIVPEDSKEDVKLSYVNLKWVVWHDGFLKLLETIILYAKTGYAHLCSDELWKKDKAAGEEALKKWGLRPVMNVFWQIPNSNPHETISQDHLHVYHIGEWGKHLFGKLKRHAAALGRSAEKKIDNQFAAFTRWCNLNHFDRVTNITYSNGNKLQDISKTANLIYHSECTHAHRRRSWLCTSTVHKSTIQAGKAEVLKFQTHLEDYIAIIEETDPDAAKNWNFPKMHASKHIFNDILAKVLDQTKSSMGRSSVGIYGRPIIRISLTRTLTSLAQVEEDNRSNHAFEHFRKKLAVFLNHFLPSHNILLPDGIRWLKLSVHDQVHEHHYLKVHYESTATWKLATDYLRCSPSFHGHEHCDCALIRTQDKDGHDKNIFVKLLFVFKYTVGNHTLDLALVLPMDASPRRRLLDRDLRLTQLHAWPAASSEFITLHSIICGALLVPDFDNHRDYFLIDYADTDMFLHVQQNLV
ncbi:hypothetical protein BD769DRAFT_1392138 [Suillus cothurnatus]|nr:hypothetical protein BD769DRAFT_1392138 [Suillus cothurnatus]